MLRMQITLTRSGVVALMLLTVACGVPQDESAQSTSTSLDIASTTTAEVTTTSTDDQTLTTAVESSTTTSFYTSTTENQQANMDQVQLAVSDLGSRLKVANQEIEIVEVESVTWPDGSLGCPEPGMVYTQALVEGFRIVLGHSDRVYLYHSGGDAEPFLCPSDEKDGGYDFVPPPGYDER